MNTLADLNGYKYNLMDESEDTQDQVSWVLSMSN